MSCDGCHHIFLNPGEFYFGDGNVRVSTLLGSCVSLLIWHPVLRHGGMCHYLLDSRGIYVSGLEGRYADEAMEIFMAELNRRKTHPSEYTVKMFGGGNMFASLGNDIGRRNIEAGLNLIERHGFTLANKDVGGNGHRRLMFDLWNGDVWMRFVDIKNDLGVAA
jgi:chemotaxis protein CheD